MTAAATTIELSEDEQCYLLDAFDASPGEWFRPTGVAPQRFTGNRLEQIVAGLVRAGMMDGQPDCHARLTERGRKHAAWLNKPTRGRWTTSDRRRRVTASVIATAVAIGLLILLMRWSGVL